MSFTRIHAPYMKASENKSCHNRFAYERMFQHIDSIYAEVLYPIATLIQSLSLKTQNMNVCRAFS